MKTASVAQPGRRARWIVGGVVVGAYILHTLLAWQLGYLDKFDTRIHGVDSPHYYVYLPALLLQGTTDFEADLRRLTTFIIEEKTVTGKMSNVWSIGPAVLWSPFFLGAHVLSHTLKWMGKDVPVDGHGAIYFSAVYAGNSLYGLAGVLIIATMLLRFFSPAVTLAVTLVVLLGSPLTYYLWSITAMSHPTSLFTSALFIRLWMTRGLGLGTACAAAMMVLSRWQNALFLVPQMVLSVALGVRYVASALMADNAAWAVRLAPLRQHVVHNLRFGALVAAAFIPQALIWKSLYDSYLTVPQGPDFFVLGRTPLLTVWFDPLHGLFHAHPVLLLGIVGLVVAGWRWPLFAASFLAIFLLQSYTNAAVHDWWAGWSFGHRRFINTLPLLAFGGAALAQLFWAFRPWRVLGWATVVVAILWNQLYIYQYITWSIPRDGPLPLFEMLEKRWDLLMSLLVWW